jgi:hypothetical protein
MSVFLFRVTLGSPACPLAQVAVRSTEAWIDESLKKFEVRRTGTHPISAGPPDLESNSTNFSQASVLRTPTWARGHAGPPALRKCPLRLLCPCRPCCPLRPFNLRKNYTAAFCGLLPFTSRPTALGLGWS